MSKKYGNGYIIRMFAQIFVFFGLFTAGQDLHSNGLIVAAIAYALYTVGNAIMEYEADKEETKTETTKTKKR